jgi:hypothetical protein
VTALNTNNLPLLMGVSTDLARPAGDLSSAQCLSVDPLFTRTKSRKHLQVLGTTVIEVNVSAGPDILDPFVIVLEKYAYLCTAA